MSHLPPLKAAWCETCQTWKPTDHHHPSEAEWRERVEAAEARAERLLEQNVHLAARLGLAHDALRGCMPVLRALSDDADEFGEQVIASDLHRLHEEISALLTADDEARAGVTRQTDGPPMPLPVVVSFLAALRNDYRRDPDAVIALLTADDEARAT